MRAFRALDLTGFVRQVADMTQDGEITEECPEGYDMRLDDAVDTLNRLIYEARELLALYQPKGKADESEEGRER